LNEVVKYHNDMNLVAFKDFAEIDFNNFFAICYKLREQKTGKITFTFQELKELGKYKRNNQRFVADLKRTYSKLIKLYIPIEDEDTWTVFTLFSDFTIKYKEKTLTVRTNEKFEYILNNLTNNFARFELEEFCNLDSRYTKTLYRLLKQFRTTGYVILKWDEFTRIMDIPSTYVVGMIDKRILKPAIHELGSMFKNLKYEKIKEHSLGGKIGYIEFKFDSENIFIINESSLFELEISKFSNFIGKKIGTTDGEKEIIVVEDLGDILKVYFEMGSVLVPNIESLKKAIV